jgi:heme-degrading monooxygenase HmoA
MHVIIWEYRVKPEHIAEFEEIYSPVGAWTKLFQNSTSYWGTELVRDEKIPHRYLTIDRWVSGEDYEAFQSQWKTEYERLDAQCEVLTEWETLLGRWEAILPGRR